MKSRYLLPHLYKKIGFLLFLVFLALAIMTAYFETTLSWLAYNNSIKWSSGNLTDELATTGLLSVC